MKNWKQVAAAPLKESALYPSIMATGKKHMPMANAMHTNWLSFNAPYEVITACGLRMERGCPFSFLRITKVAHSFVLSMHSSVSHDSDGSNENVVIDVCACDL